MKSAQKALALALLASTAHTATASPLDWLADNPKTALVFAAGAGLWAGSKLWAGETSSKVLHARRQNAIFARHAGEISEQIPEEYRPLVFEPNTDQENPVYRCFTKNTAPKIAHLVSIGAFCINHCATEGPISFYNKDGAAITLTSEQCEKLCALSGSTVLNTPSISSYNALSWQPPNKSDREKELAEVQELLDRHAEDPAPKTFDAGATDGTPADTERPADPLEKE